MDGEHFDDLLRWLTGGTSRRAVTRTLAAVALVAPLGIQLSADVTEGKKKRKKRKKRRRPTCTPQCDGRGCGDNGCGGECGSCAAGHSCLDGACCGTMGALCETADDCCEPLDCWHGGTTGSPMICSDIPPP